MVLADQCGAGFTDLVTPTNGGMMFYPGRAAFPFEERIRFALPAFGTVLVLGAVAVSGAIAIGST